jgi:tetratricopeptide (TPR) repeat protein
VRAVRLLAAVPLALAACRSAGRDGAGPRSAPPQVRSELARGDALRRSGDMSGALEAYRTAVAERPDSVPAHMRLVAALLSLGRGSEARALYAERSTAPDATEVDRTMADRLATSGASTPLRRVYTAAAERTPENPWWRLALAEVEIAEADAWNRRRAEALDRGDREGEQAAEAQARGAVRRAERALAAATPLAPRLAEVDLWRGYLRAVEGDLREGSAAKTAAYRAAADAFESAVALDPDLVEGWTGLGDARYRIGEVSEALDAWLEGARRAPADPYLREAVGLVLHQASRHEDAAEQYLAAASLDPRSADPWLRLGDARADAGRYEAALAAYREGLRRDPRAIEAHRKIGLVLEHLERPAEARSAYERYVEEGGGPRRRESPDRATDRRRPPLIRLASPREVRAGPRAPNRPAAPRP